MDGKKKVYLVLYGFSGDLFRRKLLRALWEMWLGYQKPGGQIDLRVIVTGGKEKLGFDELMNFFEAAEAEFRFLNKKIHAEQFREFVGIFEHFPGRCSEKESFAPMGRRFKEVLATGAELKFFFSLPPDAYLTTMECMASDEFQLMGDESHHVSLLFEKPAAVTCEDAERLERLIGRYNVQLERAGVVEHFAWKEGYLKFLDAAYSDEKNNRSFRSEGGVVEVFWECLEMIGSEGRIFPGTDVDSLLNHMATMLASSMNNPFDAGKTNNFPRRIEEALSQLRYQPRGEGSYTEEERFQEEQAFYKRLNMAFKPAFCFEDYLNNEPGDKLRIVPTGLFLQFYPMNNRWNGTTPFRMVHVKNGPAKILQMRYSFARGRKERFVIEQHNTEMHYADLHRDETPMVSFGGELLYASQMLDHTHSLYRKSANHTQVPPGLGDGYRRLLEAFVAGDMRFFNTLRMQKNSNLAFRGLQKKICQIVDQAVAEVGPGDLSEPKYAAKVLKVIAAQGNAVVYHRGTNPFKQPKALETLVSVNGDQC